MVKVEKLYCSIDSAVSIIASASDSTEVRQRAQWPDAWAVCKTTGGEGREGKERQMEGWPDGCCSGLWSPHLRRGLSASAVCLDGGTRRRTASVSSLHDVSERGSGLGVRGGSVGHWKWDVCTHAVCRAIIVAALDRRRG